MAKTEWCVNNSLRWHDEDTPELDDALAVVLEWAADTGRNAPRLTVDDVTWRLKPAAVLTKIIKVYSDGTQTEEDV